MPNPQSPTVINDRPYLQLEHQGQLLPPVVLERQIHRLGRDPNQVDILVPGEWLVVSRLQATFQEQGNHYLIYDNDGQTPSRNGLFLQNKRIVPRQGIKLSHGSQIKIGQDPQNFVTITYIDPNVAPVTGQLGQTRVSLQNRSVMIGRDQNATLQLDFPTISRCHAVIDRDSRGGYIIHDRSTNGIFVNGHRVNQKAALPDGVKITIGPYTLKLQGDDLLVVDQGQNLRLDAHGVTLVVSDRDSKQQRTLLHNISLPIEPGQFVALVGGSGAGKSTFMRILLGIQSPSKGRVYLNGEDLSTNFNIYRNQIGYVPQQDIVHKNLTVQEVIAYNAQLRLPSDTSPQEIKETVNRTLVQIEMADRAGVLVKNLSGGQLKRVSIGVELLADPKLFFLDEPTSGLDPGLDKKMMELLRQLADQGRTIILVTHATSNIGLCDRVAFLGKNGYLCYYGPPQEACNYFFPGVGHQDFADIYISLDTVEQVKQAAHHFLNSPAHKKYVDHSLGGTQLNTDNNPSPEKPKASIVQQLKILVSRYGRLVLGDRSNLLLSLLTAPVGIALINFALRDQSPFILGEEPDPGLAPLALKVLFVFTSTALWVGLSSSLQEIVKEQEIYGRERLVNLSLVAYLGSKGVVLGTLALVQSILMAIAVLILFQPPDNPLIPWLVGLIITNFLTLFGCMSLGLMVSAIVGNVTQANSSLPLLLIPQIIFSGVLFQMEGVGKFISWLMLSRWSVGAYGILVDVNGLVPTGLGAENLPFAGSDVYEATGSNLALNWFFLIGHAIAYTLVTWWLQKRKDII